MAFVSAASQYEQHLVWFMGIAQQEVAMVTGVLILLLIGQLPDSTYWR